MSSRIFYLSPAYGFDETIPHVGAPDNAEARLREMGESLAGTEGLVGIYIPESTEEAYQPGNKRGRVVGTVKLLPMPAGKDIFDYIYMDWDGSLRWPIGWPCEVVHAPEVEACGYLRSIVEDIHGPNTFAPFTSQFQHGPIKIMPNMSKAILAFFE